MTSSDTRASNSGDLDTGAWTGHVIVCGLHAEGLRAVEQLHAAGVDVVVVDDAPDGRLVRALGGWSVPLVAGDARLPETLARAGIGGATALVCVESDDLRTLATALLAQEMAPQLRVVAQLRNPAVGRALAATGVAVLDVARLSAPAVVEGCLRTGAVPLRLGDQDFVVAETRCAVAGTLRSLYGDLAPIAVVPRGSAHVELSPGRDRVVASGDTVVVVGTPDDMSSAGVSIGAAQRPVQAPVFVGARAPRPTPLAPSVLHQVLGALDRRLRTVLALLALLAAVSVVVLLIGYRDPDGSRMSLVDALYFTVETIATVGFGDFFFREQQTWLRLWAIGLMIIGATLATTFFALLTDTLVSRRIEESLGQRRVTALSDHVVVIGLGSIGVEVVTQLLDRGAQVVVVESDEDNRFAAQVRARGVPVVVADSTLPETLSTVRLGRARAVAVLTSDDLANIETGLAVRDLLGARWEEVPVVLRVFDRRLAATVENSLGFRFVRSTAALAAPWFVGAALGLEVLSTLYVGDQPVLVARLVVAAGGGLDAMAMRDLPARIRVVTLARSGGTGAEHPPRRDTRFGAGDVAFLIGPYEELLALLRTNTPVPA